MDPTGFEKIVGPANIALKSLERITLRNFYLRLCTEMEHCIDPIQIDRVFQCLEIFEISVSNRDFVDIAATRDFRVRVNVFDQQNNLGAKAEQLFDQPGADKPRPARDKDAPSIPKCGAAFLDHDQR